MTTNQTIDGVPRELIERVTKPLTLHDDLTDRIKARDELRALLDAPAEPKPTGLSQGWNLTRKHDGFVVGHQSLAYPPDEKAIERAERDSYVWVPFLVPAAQTQGEPVAYWADDYGNTIKADHKSHNESLGGAAAMGAARYTIPLYAEQPAPVALLLAEAREWIGDGKHADGLDREHWTPEYAALIDRIDAVLGAQS